MFGRQNGKLSSFGDNCRPNFIPAEQGKEDKLYEGLPLSIKEKVQKCKWQVPSSHLSQFPKSKERAIRENMQPRISSVAK